MGIALAAVVAEVAIIHPTYAIGPLTIILGVCILLPIGLAIRCRSGDRSGGGARAGSGGWRCAASTAPRRHPARGRCRDTATTSSSATDAISLTTRNVVHGRLLVELALVAMLALLLAWKRRYGLAGAIMAGPLVLVRPARPDGGA